MYLQIKCKLLWWHWKDTASLYFSFFLSLPVLGNRDSSFHSEVMLKKKGAGAEYPCLITLPFFSLRGRTVSKSSQPAIWPFVPGEQERIWVLIHWPLKLLVVISLISIGAALNLLIMVHQSGRKFKQAGFLFWLMAKTSCQLYKNLGTCSLTIFQCSMPCLILPLLTHN